jgi:hypothetical protein
LRHLVVIAGAIKQAFETYVYANPLSSALPDQPVTSLTGKRGPCLETVKIKKQRSSAKGSNWKEECERAA